MGLSESLWWVEGVGVIFGLRPKITPTYSLDHRISQRTVFIGCLILRESLW